jgi:hypothetical protein
MDYKTYTKEELEKLKAQLEEILASKEKEEQEKREKEVEKIRANAKAALFDYIKCFDWNCSDATINSVIDSTLDEIKRTRVRYKSDTKRYNTLEDFFNDMGW